MRLPNAFTVPGRPWSADVPLAVAVAVAAPVQASPPCAARRWRELGQR
ncbi:hypothetical protein [Streptomyces sp. NPDC058385]